MRGNSRFWIYWVLVTTLGWSAKLLDPWLFNDWGVRLLPELPKLLILSAISGLIGGIIIGIGQHDVFRRTLNIQLNDWWWKTASGSSLLAPVGIGINILIPWISWKIRGEVFLPESRSMGIYIYPMYLFFGGFILGLFQWSSLRKILDDRNWKEKSLWILGIWSSIGMGAIAGMLLTGFIFDLDIQFSIRFVVEQLVTGTVYGMVSGAIALILLGRLDSSKRADNLPQ